MSDLVNYNKRSIALPAGCKDLIDVLRRRGREKTDLLLERCNRAKVTRDESETGPLSDLAKHVRTVLGSSALFSTLCIRSPDDRLTANVGKMLGIKIRASVTFRKGSDQERAVREFLSSRGLEPADDSETPKTFLPDMPIEIICELSPLSSDPAEVARLMVELFRHVGLNEDAPMHYHLDEASDAA